ncbi:MAG TPA: nucleoside diphosphate kinase regulator [Polyangiaceae bacterium]|nr:nucleoside diphosphate kinase regulator [Polyangiaceae bacterium]
MILEVCSVHLPLPASLQEFTRRRLAPILRPFLAQLLRIEVLLREQHGKPPFDRHCSVTLRCVEPQPTLVVEGLGTGSRAAIRAAGHALGQALSQAWPDLTQMPLTAGKFRRLRPPADRALLEPAIRVTTLDNERLRRLLADSQHDGDREATAALLNELDRAKIVPPETMAHDVVTMNSRVLFRDEDTGATREVSLVYPADGVTQPDRVSVLAPIGSALLGLSVGQTIDWLLPHGWRKRLRVVQLLYQPEAAGHLHL